MNLAKDISESLYNHYFNKSIYNILENRKAIKGNGITGFMEPIKIIKKEYRSRFNELGFCEWMNEYFEKLSKRKLSYSKRLIRHNLLSSGRKHMQLFLSYCRGLELRSKLAIIQKNGNIPPKNKSLVNRAKERFKIMKYDPRTGPVYNYTTPPQWFWSPNEQLKPSIKYTDFKTKLDSWGISPPSSDDKVIANAGSDLDQYITGRTKYGKNPYTAEIIIKRAQATLKTLPSHCNDFVYDCVSLVCPQKKKNLLSTKYHYLGPNQIDNVDVIFNKVMENKNIRLRNVKPGDVMFQPKNGKTGHMEIVLGKKFNYRFITIGNQGVKTRTYKYKGNLKMFFRRLK